MEPDTPTTPTHRSIRIKVRPRETTHCSAQKIMVGSLTGRVGYMTPERGCGFRVENVDHAHFREQAWVDHGLPEVGVVLG